MDYIKSPIVDRHGKIQDIKNEETLILESQLWEKVGGDHRMFLNELDYLGQSSESN